MVPKWLIDKSVKGYLSKVRTTGRDASKCETSNCHFCYSQVHERPNCDTHGHFCMIFGNIATLTNSSTLISKIIVAKLNFGVKVVF